MALDAMDVGNGVGYYVDLGVGCVKPVCECRWCRGCG